MNALTVEIIEKMESLLHIAKTTDRHDAELGALVAECLPSLLAEIKARRANTSNNDDQHLLAYRNSGAYRALQVALKHIPHDHFDNLTICPRCEVEQVLKNDAQELGASWQTDGCPEHPVDAADDGLNDLALAKRVARHNFSEWEKAAKERNQLRAATDEQAKEIERLREAIRCAWGMLPAEEFRDSLEGPDRVAVEQVEKVLLAALAKEDKQPEPPRYSAEELRKWWPAKCPECGWRGLSRDASGGGPIADTGDYDDVTCPKCSALVEDDDEAEQKGAQP